MSLLTDLVAQRDAAQVEMDALIAAPVAEERSAETRGNFTAEEAERFEALNADLDALHTRIGQLEAVEARKATAAEKRAEVGTGSTPVVRVGAEERTYSKSNRRSRSYLQDMCRSAIGDLQASERLSAWAKECDAEARYNPNGYEASVLGDVEGRAGLTTTTGAGGTFVPPEYLIDEYVPLARAARPFADATQRMELPKGTNNIYLPKVSTGTAVAIQATQNTSVQETDLTDAYINAPVTTAAGQQTVSLQLIEQSPVQFDQIVFKDLLLALNTFIDLQCINGSGSGGNVTGVLNVSGIEASTYTSASPTGQGLFPYVGQNVALVQQNRFLPPTHTWMTPTRWQWLMTAVDGQGRPLVVPTANGPFNAVGADYNHAVEGGPVGTVLGMNVYLDASIPTNLGAGTNQDVIINARMDDLYLWEGSVTARALPQTLGNQLSVLLQVYEYFAFMGSRYPTAVGTVGGTGLVTPAFTAH